MNGDKHSPDQGYLDEFKNAKHVDRDAHRLIKAVEVVASLCVLGLAYWVGGVSALALGHDRGVAFLFFAVPSLFVAAIVLTVYLLRRDRHNATLRLGMSGAAILPTILIVIVRQT